MAFSLDSWGDDSSSEALAPNVTLFRSLADTARLAILHHLAGGEAQPDELSDALGLADSTVSAHLSHLRGCGLVDLRIEGGASYYHLARPELLDLLISVELLLVATEGGGACCPHHALREVD
ncbi:ArsR/SmtB family transcription factor [Streptomyces sedi]|uniref:Helix-turn-helix transcriptional regulator n=1 Tax=Streptomyces sedi TaxID=555059 RepID=A0A5C4UW51_9ACTN|nr:metalloregulator ArsR/SmtB family transcription factor [Streptomyces sedi]TNM27436.1 helix-turn-helix transcriptional regulator [Streptomyces sedi]